MARIIPNEDERSVRQRERYASDPEYRAMHLASSQAWRDANQERKRAYNAEWYQKNREKLLADPSRRRAQRAHHLRKNYGITIEQYEEMLEAQGGTCVCGATEPGGGGRYQNFLVDHDHETGEVRGLLCYTCNTAVGLVQDNPDTLRALADYLSAHAEMERVS
jgi:hypothetical protein